MAFTLRLLSNAALGAAVLALAACGGSDEANAAASASTDGFVRGAEDAPVIMVEYASTACPACAAFHNQVMPGIEPYIEQGLLRHEFREMITGQPQIAAAGFMLARCTQARGGDYFDAIDLLFEQQNAIFAAAAEPGGVQAQFIAIGRSLGFSENEFQACVTDEALLDQVREASDAASEAGIGATPTFMFNGERLEARRNPDGPGLVYFAGGAPVIVDGEPIAAPGDQDGFERIILHYLAESGVELETPAAPSEDADG